MEQQVSTDMAVVQIAQFIAYIQVKPLQVLSKPSAFATDLLALKLV